MEVIYRTGLKTAMSIRPSTNNDIVYIEANSLPLQCDIKTRQLKFWMQLNESNDTKLAKLILRAKELNIRYIKYYVELEEMYKTTTNCMKTLSATYKNIWKERISDAYEEDCDSKLGSYLTVNPLLKNPNVNYTRRTFELERILVTRFRTGSHNLRIETGRFCYPKVERQARLCLCNETVQTVTHVLINCPLLQHLRTREIDSVERYFEWDGIYNFLITAVKVLKIEC